MFSFVLSISSFSVVYCCPQHLLQYVPFYGSYHVYALGWKISGLLRDTVFSINCFAVGFSFLPPRACCFPKILYWILAKFLTK